MGGEGDAGLKIDLIIGPLLASERDADQDRIAEPDLERQRVPSCFEQSSPVRTNRSPAGVQASRSAMPDVSLPPALSRFHALVGTARQPAPLDS
jgi:hypothetical protein